MDEKQRHLDLFIKNFVYKTRRPRWIEKLSNFKQRGSFLNSRLHHCGDFVGATLLPVKVIAEGSFLTFFKEKYHFSENQSCYRISCMPEFDDQIISLKEALHRDVFGEHDYPAIISILAGKLVIYEPEDIKTIYLLSHSTDLCQQ